MMLSALLLALLVRGSSACYLQGQDSGHCVSTSGIAALLPFCGSTVSAYPSVCLPNEYPTFPNHTATSKDRWVQAQVSKTVERRLAIENTNGEGFTLRAFLGGRFCWRCFLRLAPTAPRARAHTPPPFPPRLPLWQCPTRARRAASSFTF